MAKELNNMNTTEAELKAVAKSLGRKGHKIAHADMLDAMATALNNRDWNTLKASLNKVAQDTSRPGSSSAAGLLPELDYTADTWALLRLAHLSGHLLPTMALPNEKAREFALSLLDGHLTGVLKAGVLVMPCDLDLRTSAIDCGEFQPEAPASASFSKQFGRFELTAQVAFQPTKGWYLTKAGLDQLCTSLASQLPEPLLRQLALYRPYQELPGYPVPAGFYTDDHVHTVEFDARPYLLQASDLQIHAIVMTGFAHSEATDRVAEWEGTPLRNRYIAKGLEHVGHFQAAGREMGFECEIAGREMLQWCAAYRASALALALCDKEGVSLTEVDVPEKRGEWGWDYDGQSSIGTFPSKEAAALDAQLRCNLLLQAIEDLVAWS